MPVIAPPLAISPQDLHTLGQWSRSSSIRAALVERAKILLLAAEGLSNTEIAHRVGCSRPTVILWRHRYTTAGLDGLLDQPRPGRPQSVRADRRAEILAATLSPPPEHLGVTHWSTRRLGDELGVSHTTVARVWRDHDLKPWRTETFKFSTDPQLEAKIRDVVGLDLHPPERAIVGCVDEKSQIQALSRTAPNLPLRPGSPERRTHDYTRHGTTTLFAALEVATGKVTDQCYPRHRHAEFLALPPAGGQGVSAAAAAPGAGQLRHPHPSHSQGLAGPPSKDPPALHPDLGELDEPGRGVLCHHHPPGDPAGQLPERSRPDRCHRPLRRWLEPAQPPLCVGQRRRRHHDQGDP
jgi:transposase